jgi:AraC-like DNA-binding protein
MGKFRAYIDSDISATHTLTASALRPHFHSGYVIGYLFSGRYHCRLNQKQNFEYGPGEITLLNPGEVHQDFSSKQVRDYITVNIQERLFARGLDDFGAGAGALPCFFRPRLQADPQVEEIFEDLRQAIDGQHLEREFVIRDLVTRLALYLSGHFASAPPHALDSDLEKATTRWEIRRGIELLRDTYTQQFDLDQFARVVGLSKYYLEKVFKKATGLSPYQFVIQMRVEKAKLLLASTSRSIIDISMELGFFDQSHFTNSFRNFTGTSPLAYRLATR